MSFDALAWAAKQNTGSSGTKLVLLGLAECASRGHGLAFPSIAELVEFSSLDRKSVIANLDKLVDGGFIVDTGRKVGRTGQIKVYQVIVPKTEPSQKRNSSDISANSPENGTRNKSEPVTEANASGAAADPVKEMVDLGVALLTATGTTEKNARSLIGKWRKLKGDGAVLTALIDCRARAITQPIEWLEKRFGGVNYISASGYEYRGDIERVIRESERRADWTVHWKAKADLRAEQATRAA